MAELGVVRRKVKRAERAAVEALGRYGVATVHEAMGRVGLMKPYMRPIYPGALVSGTAVTVLLHPGDNWMMHVVAGEMSRATSSSRRSPPTAPTAISAIFGHELHGSRRQGPHHRRRGARRKDSDRDGFSRLEQARSAKGTVKATLGSVNVSVVCAGAAVNPGDAIIADDDGVVGCRPNGRERPQRLPRRARPTRATSAPSSPPACWVSTCTRCASRSKRRV